MATESLDLEDLKHPEGVQRLLAHLWQELEPLEHLRTFTTLSEFYKDFRRSPGQEFVEFDMQFRAHLKRLEEVGAKLEGLNVAYWFLEKSGLSSDLRKQVVAAASGEYDYPKLRKALMAIVPKVRKEDDNHPTPSRPSFNRQWKPRNNATRQVNAAVEDEEQTEDADGERDEVGPEELEGELEILLTQAARKCSEIERARGFSKPASAQAREARIREMKSRMPSSACKAQGRTSFGHWHGDPECPFRKGGSGDKDRHKDKSVLVVVEEELSDSDEDILDPPTSSIYYSTSPDLYVDIPDDKGQLEQVHVNRVYSNWGEPDRNRLALSDTCCARTVAGKQWIRRHLRYLRNRGEDVFVIDEARPYRFGGGPRVMSEYAVIMPVVVRGASRIAWVRVSVVDQEVPLLLSKGALKSLGMVMDLENSTITLRELGASVPLRETKAGLCGFEINVERSQRRLDAPPEVLADTDQEVVLEDNIPGDQVMIVKKIAPETEASDKVRATRDGVDRCEDEARRLYRERDYSYTSLLHLVRMLPIAERVRHRDINGQGPVNEAWVAGLYAHGAYGGITKRTLRYPNVVRYINSFMVSKSPGTWSSFSLTKNICTDMHIDCHNDKDASSCTVSFGQFDGGELWVAQPEGGTHSPVWKRDKHGKNHPGMLVSTRESPYELNPQILHATQPWRGERWCLSMYTTRNATQADEEVKKALKKLLFPLSRRGRLGLWVQSCMWMMIVMTCRSTESRMNQLTTCLPHRAQQLRSYMKVRSRLSAQCLILCLASLVDFSRPMSTLAPKTKEEYVLAVASRSKVPRDELRKHTLDRLKELWAAVRPPKGKTSILPVNWKKLDRTGLKMIYQNQVVPDLGRENDLHWDRWSKPALLLEIEVWAEDAAKDFQLDRDLDMSEKGPLCVSCGVPMMERTNRLTREGFFGCRRFPSCKTTHPLTYAGRPTEQVQRELGKAMPVKHEEMPDERKMMYRATNRPNRGGATGKAATFSDGSWVATGLQEVEEVSSDENPSPRYNTNLTKEEMAMIVAPPKTTVQNSNEKEGE